MRRLVTTTSASWFAAVRLALEAEGVEIVATNDLAPGMGVPYTISVPDADYDLAAEIVAGLDGGSAEPVRRGTARSPALRVVILVLVALAIVLCFPLLN